MITMFLFVVIWLALVATWIAAIVSASKCPDAAFTLVARSRGATVLLVVLTGWIGAMYYWLVIRRELRAALPVR